MARRRTRNPFNATKPAEWATMSKKLRKAWNRKHWRPEQWKCDLALKREATRMAHRRDGSTSGKGLEQLAEKLSRQNPGRVAEPEYIVDRDRNSSRYVWVVYDPVTSGAYCSGTETSPDRADRAGRDARTRISKQGSRANPPRDTVRLLLQHPALARVVARSSGSARAKIVAKLEQVAERARLVRRSNPRRGKARWKAKVRREARKLTTLSSAERRRIDREELASGFAVNPRRRRRR